MSVNSIKYYKINCCATGTVEPPCAEAPNASLYIGEADDVTMKGYDEDTLNFNCTVVVNVGVFANSEQEAVELAQDIIEDADFGDIEDVTVDTIQIKSKAKEVEYSDIDVSKYSAKTLKTLATQCNGNETIMSKLSDYNSKNYNYSNPYDYVLADAIINNCNSDPTILKKYINNENYRIREEVAYNSNGNEEILNLLVGDDEPSVRVQVACACAGNLDILNKLSKDKDKDVRKSAKDSIKEYKEKKMLYTPKGSSKKNIEERA